MAKAIVITLHSKFLFDATRSVMDINKTIERSDCRYIIPSDALLEGL